MYCAYFGWFLAGKSLQEAEPASSLFARAFVPVESLGSGSWLCIEPSKLKNKSSERSRMRSNLSSC